MEISKSPDPLSRDLAWVSQPPQYPASWREFYELETCRRIQCLRQSRPNLYLILDYILTTRRDRKRPPSSSSILPWLTRSFLYLSPRPLSPGEPYLIASRGTDTDCLPTHVPQYQQQQPARPNITFIQQTNDNDTTRNYMLSMNIALSYYRNSARSRNHYHIERPATRF